VSKLAVVSSSEGPASAAVNGEGHGVGCPARHLANTAQILKAGNEGEGSVQLTSLR
jgi:hypothetical protein